MIERQLLFSVTKKDLRIDTFKVGGNGGQHRDKTDAGVRITHIASGAVGSAQEDRSQAKNKTIAFRRMATSEQFENWRKREAAKRLGVEASIEAEVNRQMHPKNIRVETHDEKGRWVEITEPLLDGGENNCVTS